MVELWWGLNPPGGQADRYGGRVHVVVRDAAVLPDGRTVALCTLPVEAVTPDRTPGDRRRLCPECCIRAMGLLFPADHGETKQIEVVEPRDGNPPQSVDRLTGHL